MVYPESWKCPNCNTIIKNNKTCYNCRFKYSMHYPHLWHCPECKELVSESRNCTKCNYPDDLHYPKLWHCPKCGKLVRESTKCGECGYEKKERAAVKGSSILQEKIIDSDFFKSRKNILLFSLGIITLLGVILLFSVPAAPKNSFVTGEVFAGEGFTPRFLTSTTAQRVLFEFTSPNGRVYEYAGTELENGEWIIPNLVLNESGDWNVIIKITSFGALIELIDSITASAACRSNNDCREGICCFGSCVELCSSNLDCDDGNIMTGDFCRLAGTCDAYCSYTEPLCFSSISDGYCPSTCSLEDDVDCTNCPEGKILCDNECYKPCYINSDCNDGDSSTSDECIASSDPCKSYCVHTFYSDMGCPEGTIRVGTNCVKPGCFVDDDCDDGRNNYAHKCYNPGTENAYCYHQPCLQHQIVCSENGVNQCRTPVCKSNSDCDTGSPNTFYYCMNPNTCDAYCISNCEPGFKKYNNECMKICSSIHDCAVYEGLGSSYCLNYCLESESCMINCYSNLPLSLKCDYANNICKVYECVNNAGCDDNNFCTYDYCDDNRCIHSYARDNTIVNNGLNTCCNGELSFYCADNNRCNEPDYYYDFSNTFPVFLNRDIPSSQLSFAEDALVVEIKSGDDLGSGAYHSIECINGSSFIISVDVMSAGGGVSIWFEANAEANSVYNNISTTGWNNWQTYTINGTMDCSKPRKDLVFYSNSPGPFKFYVDNLRITMGRGAPRLCYNAVPCDSECIEQSLCSDGDGLCPSGCFKHLFSMPGYDNDCSICEPPMILCDDDCFNVPCYADSDCPDWYFVCENPGGCEASCYPLPVYSRDFNDGDYSGIVKTHSSVLMSVSSEQLKVTADAGQGVMVNIKEACSTGSKYKVNFDVSVLSGCGVNVLYSASGNSQSLTSGAQSVEFSNGTLTCASDDSDNLIFTSLPVEGCTAEFSIDNLIVFIE